ncbi:MAG: hypothetical protein ACRDKV_00320 [Solirubrobacterales bacterium]
MAKSRKRRPRSSPSPAPKPRKLVEPAPRRTARDQPPQAPWGSFPLTELAILVGIVIMTAGFFGALGGILAIVVGITLAGLGGLELAVREHFAGYRSHSGLLALGCAVLTAAVLTALSYLAFSSVIPLIPVAAGALVFVPALIAMRGAVRRASGGLSFRIGRLRG